MKEFSHRDRCGPWRRRWRLRMWVTRPSWWWFNYHFIRPLADGWRSSAVEFRTRTIPGGTCYCPLNTGSEIRLVFAGFGLWFWCDRDRMPRPCLCDLALWEGIPEDYGDEIQEYGGIERVRRLIEFRLKQVKQMGFVASTR